MPLENLPEKCCGNCSLFLVHWFADMKGEARDISGTCQWSEDQLPTSLKFANRERIGVYATDGTQCPCHVKGKPYYEHW